MIIRLNRRESGKIGVEIGGGKSEGKSEEIGKQRDKIGSHRGKSEYVGEDR